VAIDEGDPAHPDCADSLRKDAQHLIETLPVERCGTAILHRTVDVPAARDRQRVRFVAEVGEHLRQRVAARDDADVVIEPVVLRNGQRKLDASGAVGAIHDRRTGMHQAAAGE